MDDEIPGLSDNGLVSFDDAAHIGFKVAEMADRVRVGHACLPGAKMTWGMEMDGVRYTIAVTVEDPVSRQTGAAAGGEGDHAE